MAVAETGAPAHGTPDSKASLLSRLVGAQTPFQTKRAVWGYVYAAPWILGLIIFWGGPILASFYFGFTEYAVIGSPKFTGLSNYIRAFSGDELFWPSLGRTFTFAGLYIPFAVGGALVLAVLLNQKLMGTTLFRTLFFVPHLIPAVALAVVWTFSAGPPCWTGKRIPARHRHLRTPWLAGVTRQRSCLRHHDQCLGRHGRQHHVDLPGRTARRAAGTV